MSTILGMKFADAPSLYSKEQLDIDLAAGVGKVIAGIGSNYKLNVDTDNAFISLSHKDSVFMGTAVPGSVKPAIGISAAGIAMGYNRASDGAWVNSVAIDASGNASFSGAINATSGNFTGTITAGSIITNSVTVDGTSLSTIKSGAAAGGTAVQPATLTTALSVKLDNAAATIMASGFSLKTPNYDSTVAGTGGMAIYQNGIIGRKRNPGNTGWDNTVVIGTDGNITVKGDISGSTGTFAGTVSASNITGGTITATVSINSAGSINATGVYGSSLGNVAIVGAPTGTAHGVAGIGSGSGTAGVYGMAGSTGYGVIGTVGVGGTYGVFSEGKFGTSTNALVYGLNAQYINGNESSAFLPVSGSAYNSDRLGGSLASLYFKYTGSTISAGPVGGRTAVWASVSVNGSSYYVLIS